MNLTFEIKKPSYLLCVFLFLLFTEQSHSQSSKEILNIEAQVMDKETKGPLPFTNVIIEGTSIGTITNEEGVFELSFNRKHESKNIIFSFVGYKNSVLPIATFDDPKKIIYLESTSTPLEEIVVTVKNKYKELVDAAIIESSNNYAQVPVFMETYYRELTKIDDNYTKFTDAACSLYYTPYDNTFDFQKSKIGFMQFKRLEYEIKKVPFPEPRDLIADSRDYVKVIALRKSDNLQNYKILEQSNQLNAIDTTNLKWVENNEIGGGPLRLTGADKIKRRADFFDPKLNHKYQFTYSGKSIYNNRPVYIIGFAPKDSNDFEARYKGNLTIDEKSKAIISYRYELTSNTKKRLNQKFAAQLKTPTSVEKDTKLSYITRTTSLVDSEVIVSYFEYNERWYLKRIKVINNYTNSGDLFDDFSCTTESEMIVNGINSSENQKIERTNRFNSTFSNSLFNYAINYDSKFWKNYSTLVATGIVGKALQDLQTKSTLEEQFKNKK